MSIIRNTEIKDEKLKSNSPKQGGWSGVNRIRHQDRVQSAQHEQRGEQTRHSLLLDENENTK